MLDFRHETTYAKNFMSIIKRLFYFIVLLLAANNAMAQFQYHFNQDVPVVQGSSIGSMAWAGGLNAGQYNTIDLDNDGLLDLMIFDRDNNKVLTFISDGSKYTYAPELEHLFPAGLKSWVVLRDYNCDGKADLFTSSLFGMSLYENVTAGGQLEWLLIHETIFTEGASGQVNLQVSSLDLPGIQDVDGDGDLDILAFNFAVGGGVHYHQNMSVENTGSCGLDLVRITERYGDFEECTCDEYIFGSEVCSAGGRLQHSGGKSIVSYPYSGVMAQDLVIGQEECTNTGFLQNMGTVQLPQMTSVSFNFPNATNPITLGYPALFNVDVDFDGEADLISSNNAFDIHVGDNYSQNNWFFKKEGSNYNLITKAFLQEDMIDVGYAASPALADMNDDGDADLVIGSGSNGGGARLVLFENDGDALNPRLAEKDSDYLQLSAADYQKISPQFLDVNLNGQQDLIIKYVENSQQKIAIYWHTNNSLQPFEPANKLNLEVPSVSVHDNPYFYFRSGKLALLIGRETGKLSQYINQGSLTSPEWELITDSFLDIADDFRARNISVAINDMDADGKQDLIRYDDSGILKIYADFNGTAILTDNLLQDKQTLNGYNSSFGADANVSTTNLTGSKLPSIVAGLKSGGLQLLSNVVDEQQEVDLDIKIAVFPNPLDQNDLLSLVANQDVVFELIDVWGHTLSEKILLTKGVIMELDIYALRAGLYMVRAQSFTGKKSSAKFVVTN
jgi:hypothetical protein